jgi:AbrB family looped-hinge helix DNA binding protein
MTTVLSQNGQIVLPSALRERMHLQPGQDFEVSIEDEDTILLRRISHAPNRGLIDLLQACPYPLDLPPRAKDLPRSVKL